MRSETDLDRANRMLMMLSKINRAGVRAESPDALFREACRIALDCGLFRFVSIGLADSTTDRIRMMTGCGNTGTDDEFPLASSELAHAVWHSDGTCVYNKLDGLPEQLQGQELMRQGFSAMAGLLLHEGGKPAGTFLLYADHSNCFDETVVQMLQEAADDISFSLGNMLSEQRRLAAESKLYYMAFYDAQTGLPNRALLDERLPSLAERGGLALMDIRVQRLDQALHLFGRLAMDDMLRTLASRLEAFRGNEGFLAKLGQDEFVVALPGQTDESAIARIAQSLLTALAEPVRFGEKEAFLHASIGAAVYPKHESDIGLLLRRARAAADHNIGDRAYCLYSSEFDRGLEQRARTEAELHRALERSEFQLYYQPQLSLRSGAIVGVEALLHWRHPQRGLVMPGEFIPLLEECGLMPAVGTWVLREACRQAREWQLQGLAPVRMAVNLSALQFKLVDLVEIVRDALEAAEMSPERLELELTESLILENVEQTIQAMHDLKHLGISLSLDDFGTGYSSLSYLRRYPVDRIKIDQSFIRDMHGHAGSAALVRSILAMAHNLGLHTIAEGVETVAQFDYLRKQPCDEMQGFLFSRAVPASEIAHMLAEGQRLVLNQAAASGYAVLLVDADPASLARMQEALKRDNRQALIAASEEEAFSLLAAHDIGVLVSGLSASDSGAAEFLHRAKEMFPDTVRILLAADVGVEAIIQAVNAGEVYRLIAKPVDEEPLCACVRDACRRYEAQVRSDADRGNAALAFSSAP